MNSKDINLRQLNAVALALDDLLPHVTFVGGSTTILLVDEAAHHGVRQTDDVDVIIDVTTRVEYHSFSKRLRELGFREDTDGPICRWLIDTNVGEIKLDVMPIDKSVLGFSNRWYKKAMEHAVEHALPDSTVIRVVDPIYFLATKFEAFSDRGGGDYFSHDLEDIVFVLENRSRIIVELMDCSEDMKLYFSQCAASLLNDQFLNVLPGLLNSSDAASAVENNLSIMKSWTED